MRNHFLRATGPAISGIIFVEEQMTNTDLTTYTFTMNVGSEEHPHRHLVIMPQGSRNFTASTFTFTGITVNGNPVSAFIGKGSGSSSSAVATGIGVYPLPTGTTATIAATCSQVASYGGISVGYFFARSGSVTVLDSYSSSASGSVTYGDTTATAPKGLLIVAGGSTGSTTDFTSFVNIEEVYARADGVSYPGSLCERRCAESSVSWSMTRTGSSDASCACALSII